jgi:hypothetical protein
MAQRARRWTGGVPNAQRPLFEPVPRRPAASWPRERTHHVAQTAGLAPGRNLGGDEHDIQRLLSLHVGACSNCGAHWHTGDASLHNEHPVYTSVLSVRRVATTAGACCVLHERKDERYEATKSRTLVVAARAADLKSERAMTNVS